MIVAKESLKGLGILEKKVGCDKNGMKKESEYARGLW